LVKSGVARNTSKLSRDHTIETSRSGLISIAGGKWTTYRKMGEDVVTVAARVGELPARESKTADLPLHGTRDEASSDTGNDQEIKRAVRDEMARTVEDVLSRRSRQLLLDARAAVKEAPLVAEIMARLLSRDSAWQNAQVNEFTELARGYCWDGARL
jgi:glycerol-3-phosphate dehydrogenase